MHNINWQCLTFQRLDKDQLYQIFQLRSEVFVVEQQCVYQDLDGLDQEAMHLIGESQSAVVAYARLLQPGQRYPGSSIGRVVTSLATRGSGMGKQLMHRAIQQCEQLWPDKPITISAQQQLEHFYQQLGFRTVSDAYLEDGIPHIEMHRSN